MSQGINWAKKAKQWAKKIKDQIQPFSLQREIALVIAWDCGDPEVTKELRDWLGDDGAIGRLIPIHHRGLEVWDALEKIGYPIAGTKRTRKSIQNQDAYANPDASMYDRPDGVKECSTVFTKAEHEHIHDMFVRFFGARGMELPTISRDFVVLATKPMEVEEFPKQKGYAE